jgi:DNA-binding transcriptional MerR regulator
MSECLSKTDLADLCNVSVDTIDRWVRQGLLPQPLPRQPLVRKRYFRRTDLARSPLAPHMGMSVAVA